jgi:hypothetical protein
VSDVAGPEEFKVEGASGLPITLPISTGPATGYAWEIDLPNGVARLADASERDAKGRPVRQCARRPYPGDGGSR